MAERPSLAAAALAWRGAGRARDHGRRRGDGRQRDPARGGAGRRPDRGAGGVPDRPRRRRGRRLRAGRGAGAGPARVRRVDFEPQPEEGVTYAEKIGPADRELDWSRPPQELHDRIRALSPHIGARGEVEGRSADRLALAPRRRPARSCSTCSRRAGSACRTTPGSAAYAPDVAWKDWMRTVEVEPSLYAADFSRLGEQIDELLNAGARVFHYDVGDGHFVEPITIGPIVLESIAPAIHERGGVLDCHLMVDNPAAPHPAGRAGGRRQRHRSTSRSPTTRGALIALAREHGLGVGVAFNPQTSRRARPRARRGRRPRALHEHLARLLGPGVHARGAGADRAAARAAP